MLCKKCKKKAYYNEFCKKCFCQQIEARVRKELRLKKLIQKNDVLLITSPFCEYMVKSIMKGLPLKIVKKGKHDKKVILWTMDDEIEYFLKNFFAGKKYIELSHHGKNIKLFLKVKHDELMAFARAKGFKLKKKKITPILEMIEKLEKKHPETKFSLGKSMEKLAEISRK
ncbi:hypothetical protein KY339_01165 [Candidatus Woesearchaeota archaeon]|nr:hypothetical protein [Candidatus Woesearchaeota archaeon]